MCYWQKKDVDVQTSLERINVDPDVKSGHTTLAGEYSATASLPPCTSTAVCSDVVPAAPEHQHHIVPSRDVHTSRVSEMSSGPRMESGMQRTESGGDRSLLDTVAKDQSCTSRVSEMSDGPRMESGMQRTESSRDRSLLYTVAKDQSCAERDHRRRQVPPSHGSLPRARSLSPGTRFDESGIATGSELPLSARSAPVGQSSDIHISTKPYHNGHKKLPFSDARVPSRSVSYDNCSSRILADTNDENAALSRNRGPSFDGSAKVSVNNENKIPRSRTRVPPSSVDGIRGPSDSRHVELAVRDDDGRPCVSGRTRVAADSDNVANSYNERSDQRRRSGSQSWEVVGISSEADELMSVWSEGSPQCSMHHQPRRQLSQVLTCLLSFLSEFSSHFTAL